MKLEDIFTAQELADIDAGTYDIGQPAFAAKLTLWAALEREACAQACDEIHAKHIAEFGDYIEGSYAKDCAAAIRARRNT